MKAKEGFLVLLLLLICPFVSLTARIQEEVGDKAKYGLKPPDYALPPGAIELKHEFSFPTKDDEEKGIYLSQVGELRASPQGLLFVSDQRSSEVQIYDINGKHLRTMGRFGQGPGEFMTPSQLAFLDDKVIVRDIGNQRIQSLAGSGAYLGGFRVFRDYWALTALENLLYTVPIHYRYPSENKDKCLVDVIDFQGKVVKSFGALLDVNPYDSVPLTCAHITLSANNELWLAFKWFPIVRKYSLEGELRAEYRYTYKAVEKKESFNSRMMDQRTKYAQVSYYPICSGIYATKKGLYLLGSSPKRLDIFLLDPDGRLLEFYWHPLDRPYWCCGLYVIEEESGPVFYSLDHHTARIEVYKIKGR